MGKIAEHFGRLPEGDTVRLALGELVDDDGLIPAWRARDAFLIALVRDAPACATDLITTPDIARSFTKFLTAVLEEPGKERTQERQKEIDESGCAYNNAIERWAIEWNLDSEWIYPYATTRLGEVFFQMNEIRQIGGGTTEIRPGTGPREARVTGGVPLSLIAEALGDVVSAPVSHPRLTFGGKQVGPDPDETIWPLNVFDPEEEFDFEWNPYLESKADNMKTAVAWFKARYRAAQDAREKEAGGRRAARKPKPFYHFEWAVRYQVLGHEFVDIARDAPANLQTVIDGVRNVLALIELEERQRDRPGITANGREQSAIPHSL